MECADCKNKVALLLLYFGFREKVQKSDIKLVIFPCSICEDSLNKIYKSFIEERNLIIVERL